MSLCGLSPLTYLFQSFCFTAGSCQKWEMLKMVTPQLQVTKKWRLKFNCQASPEDQEVFSSQKALPLMETKWKEKCSGREKGCTWSPHHLQGRGQIYSPWCTKQRTYSCLPITTEDRRKKKKECQQYNKSICPNLPIAAGRRGSKQGSFTHRKRALTPMAMDYLSPNSANLTYSIRERSICVDKGGTWPYTSLEKRNRVLSASSHSLLLITATMTTLWFPRS